MENQATFQALSGASSGPAQIQGPLKNSPAKSNVSSVNSSLTCQTLSQMQHNTLPENTIHPTALSITKCFHFSVGCAQFVPDVFLLARSEPYQNPFLNFTALFRLIGAEEPLR